jgi:hypothetical protein
VWRVDFPVNTNNQTTRLYLRLLFWVAVALVISVATAHASTRAATLEAIHQLENPRNLSRPGPRGELGAYQFRSQTWRMYTAAPFASALDRTTSDAVAIKHYEWIRTSLERTGMPATPYAIGLAWNGGLEAVIRGNSPRAARDYAQRVANLAASLNSEAPVVDVASPVVASPVMAAPLAAAEPAVETSPYVVTVPTAAAKPRFITPSSVVAMR